MSSTQSFALPLRTIFLSDRRALWRIGALGFLTLVPVFVSGLLVAKAVDAALVGRTESLWLVLGLFGLFGLLTSAAVFAYVRESAAFTERLRCDVTQEIVKGTLAAAIATDHYKSAGAAELMQHAEQIHERLANVLRIAGEAASALVAVAGIALLSPLLAALTLPFVAGTAVLLTVSVRPRSRLARRSSKAYERASGSLSLHVTSVRDLLAFSAGEEAIQRLQLLFQDLFHTSLRSTRAASVWSSAAVGLSVVFPLSGVLLAIDWLLAGANLTVGESVGTITYVLSGVYFSANVAGSLFDNLVALRTHTRRVMEMAQDPAKLPRRARLPSPPTAKGSSLTCRDLSFSYGDSSSPIVDGLNLRIARGEHIAIVGPSGIGKSTLAALLAGQIAPTAGLVLLDDEPVLEQAYRHDFICTAPQESYVFSGTLRDNLTYVARHADTGEVFAVINELGLEGVVDRLGGIDQPIDTTRSGLSEGEKQLISLARLYLAQASVYILDESACYLNAAADQRAETAFASSGATLITVAHRLSSAERADRVIYLDREGAHVGTHAELLRSRPTYAAMFAHWRSTGFGV